MTVPTREPETQPERGRNLGDALGAMYVVAAAVMGLGFLIVVVLIFVPSDWREMFEEPSDVYVPGSTEVFSAPPPGPLEEPPGVTRIAPGQYRVVLVAYNWEFEPKEIRVPAGSEAHFVMRSGQDYHGFALIGTPITVPLVANAVTEATHVFDEPGEYLWVCSEYCGAGHATMQGKVIVE